jgi:hypothetical protein
MMKKKLSRRKAYSSEELRKVRAEKSLNWAIGTRL